LDRFDAEGLAPFLSAYRQFDALAGRDIEVQSGERRESGIALGVATDGALRVRIDGTERELHAGEVSVRRR
ncbi:MAG: bifunctional biotin--[acetyl-CoA-carboxylase] synthetase/biotin operon repressor, partial [Luteimonas sp.]